MLKTQWSLPLMGKSALFEPQSWGLHRAKTRDGQGLAQWHTADCQLIQTPPPSGCRKQEQSPLGVLDTRPRPHLEILPPQHQFPKTRLCVWSTEPVGRQSIAGTASAKKSGPLLAVPSPCSPAV